MTSEAVRRCIEQSREAHSDQQLFHAHRPWANCIVCSIPTRRKCKACWRKFRDEVHPEDRVVVPYCSRRCQKIDLPFHKQVCAGYEEPDPFAPEPEDRAPPEPAAPLEDPPPPPSPEPEVVARLPLWLEIFPKPPYSPEDKALAHYLLDEMESNSGESESESIRMAVATALSLETHYSVSLSRGTFGDQ